MSNRRPGNSATRLRLNKVSRYLMFYDHVLLTNLGNTTEESETRNRPPYQAIGGRPNDLSHSDANGFDNGHFAQVARCPQEAAQHRQNFERERIAHKTRDQSNRPNINGHDQLEEDSVACRHFLHRNEICPENQHGDDDTTVGDGELNVCWINRATHTFSNGNFKEI